SSRRRHTRSKRDWSSDVCSSDLVTAKADIDVSTDAFKTWAKSFGTQVATTTAADNTLTFTGLSYGYYYVQSSLGTTITVDSTNRSEERRVGKEGRAQV